MILVFFSAPPSVRDREPEAPRYTGSTVPSRSFRFLQMMTQNDQQNDEKPTVGGYVRSQATMNRYDEQISSNISNKLENHPSRAFKYLQEMTGNDQQQQPAVTATTTVIRTGTAE